MALQGTLDTFGLPDLLRLMESTGKRGALKVSSQALSGTVWIEEARIIASDASDPVPPGDHVAVLFKLLCLSEGEFEFLSDDAPARSLKRMAVLEVLEKAESQLAEWEEIQKVIPGMLALISLAPELPSNEITLDADQWRFVSLIGAGKSVTDLGAALELSQVPLCRQLKVLVEMGIATAVEVDPADLPATAAPAEKESLEEPAAEERVTTITPEISGAPLDIDETSPISPMSTTIEPESQTGDKAADADAIEDETDAVERLKARVDAVKESPVVRDAESEEDGELTEDEAALLEAAGIDPETGQGAPEGLFPTGADGEDINRGTLLKFLSSVRT